MLLNHSEHAINVRKPDSEIDRIEGYFDEMKEKYDNGGKYTVYVIHLNQDIKRHWDSPRKRSSFPRGKYENLDSRGLVSHQGCVYVGYTGKDVRTRFKEHLDGVNCQNKIVTNFPFSREFDEAVMEEKFLISGIETQEVAMKLESWYGWALYRSGFMVWGPHYHREIGFLLSDPFW